MPEVDEMVGATLNYKLRVARGNVRKFLAAATEGVDLGKYADVVQAILAAVGEIEADTRAPLDASNEKGWKALQKRVEVRSPRLRPAWPGLTGERGGGGGGGAQPGTPGWTPRNAARVSWVQCGPQGGPMSPQGTGLQQHVGTL